MTTGLLVGLIGAHIQASRTPLMHEREADALGIRCEYRLIDLDTLRMTTADLSELLAEAEREGFAGLNVTHPCKQAIIPLLTTLTDESRLVGAVNTIVLLAGAVLFWSVTAVAHAFARTALGFGIARFALGIGEAANFPAAVKAVAEWFPASERALATGLFNSGVALGAVVASVAVPILAASFGWQAAFIATGALGLLWIPA